MGLDSFSYLFLSSLLTVLLFPSASAANAHCPRGWLVYEASCFGFFNIPMNWGDAEVACQSYGGTGHLASIHDKDEMKAVSKYIFRNYKSDTGIWIGLYDTKKGGTVRNREFKWSDGTQVWYMPWSPEEPNSWEGKEFCVELKTNDFKEWNDAACVKEQPYLCKFSP